MSHHATQRGAELFMNLRVLEDLENLDEKLDCTFVIFSNEQVREYQVRLNVFCFDHLLKAVL